MLIRQLCLSHLFLTENKTFITELRLLELSVCVSLQSYLGGAGGAQKKAGEIGAVLQRAQAEHGEAGKQGRAEKVLCSTPAFWHCKFRLSRMNIANNAGAKCCCCPRSSGKCCRLGSPAPGYWHSAGAMVALGMP